jgi:hypothetical protein
MIDLRNVNVTHKNARIQYSYANMPVIKNGTTTKYTVADSDNSFTYQDDGVSIKSNCTEILIIPPSHNVQLGVDMQQDADLVLKHTIPNSNGINFYVVIPLVQDPTMGQDVTTVSSQVQSMFEKANTVESTYNFNTDLQKIKPNIVCYKDSKTSSYVFVFNKPILTKAMIKGTASNPFSGVQYTTTGKGKRKRTTSTAFLVKNTQNIDDTIECEYVTQTDTNATKADKKMVTDIFVWVFLTLGLILCLIYALKIIDEKVADKSTIFTMIGGLGTILLIIYIRMFSTSATKKIQYGSMMMFSLAMVGLSLMAYNGMLSNGSVP